MQIVLLGYMGSGKSTIGKTLAGRLAIPFLDLDEVIKEEVGMSIPEIFKEKGELYFRKKEHKILKDTLLQTKNMVLALGGGTPCYSENMKVVLDKTSLTFYLRLSIPELVKRLSPEKENRPLIRDIPEKDLPTFIGKHLFERQPYYHMANYTIDCDGKEPGAIIAEISKYLV